MAEAAQKKEFVQSLKRLVVFFNSINQYAPTPEILSQANLIDLNLETQFDLVSYKKKSATEQLKLEDAN